MEENEKFDSDFSNDKIPISEEFWNYMENYWHNNREFPESTEASLSKKADLVDGKVPSSQLPSYVDDVLEFDTFENLPNPGEKGKIYLITNDNSQFRWSGSEYIQLNSDEFVMTTNTIQYLNPTGTKNFYTEGGTQYFHNSLWIRGNNEGAAISFIDNGIGQLRFTQDNFYFTGSGGTNMIPIHAGAFVKAGYNNEFILLAGGGHVPITEFVTNPDLNTQLSFYHKIDFTGSINNGSPSRTNKSWFDYHWAETGQRGSVINFSGLNGNYSTELFGSYDSPNNIAIRTRNGDTSSWNAPRWLWHDKNFNPNNYWAKYTHPTSNYVGINSNQPFSFLNNNAAQQIFSGGLLTSDNYADAQLIPTNGIYSNGDIISNNNIKAKYFNGNGFTSNQLNGTQVFSCGNDTLYIGNAAGLQYINFETGGNDLKHYRTDLGYGVIWDAHNFNPDSKISITDADNKYIAKVIQFQDNFNTIEAYSSGLYRADNNAVAVGVKYLYAPMLHLGGYDTKSQLQINYANGSIQGGELSYRGGINDTFTEWRTAWDNVNFDPDTKANVSQLGNFVTLNTEQIITNRKVINKDLGTNNYIGVAQHFAQFQIGRVSDQKSLEFAVTDDGKSYIQSKEAGVGYNALILNRNNSGGVAIGDLPLAGYGLTVGGSIYSSEIIQTQNYGNSNQWNQSYQWGNHALVGYATVSQLNNYIPISHPSYGITQNEINEWRGYLGYWDNRQIQPSHILPEKLQFGFTSWNNDVNYPYADFIHFGGYNDSSGGNQNLIVFKKNGFGIRQFQGKHQDATPYQSFVDFWNTGDFTQSDINNWNNNRFNKAPINLITSSFDANTINESGFYRIGYGTSNTGGYSSSNDGLRTLLHFETEDVYSASQIQTERYTGNTISRTRTDGVWSNWIRHWGNNDFSQSDINNWNNIANTATTQSWVESQDYANHAFVEESLNQLTVEHINPDYPISTISKVNTIIITEEFGREYLELEREFIPERQITVTNLSPHDIGVMIEDKIIDRVLSGETTEYYITSEKRLVKKGSYRNASLLV